MRVLKRLGKLEVLLPLLKEKKKNVQAELFDTEPSAKTGQRQRASKRH